MFLLNFHQFDEKNFVNGSNMSMVFFHMYNKKFRIAIICMYDPTIVFEVGRYTVINVHIL